MWARKKKLICLGIIGNEEHHYIQYYLLKNIKNHISFNIWSAYWSIEVNIEKNIMDIKMQRNDRWSSLKKKTRKYLNRITIYQFGFRSKNFILDYWTYLNKIGRRIWIERWHLHSLNFFFLDGIVMMIIKL